MPQHKQSKTLRNTSTQIANYSLFNAFDLTIVSMFASISEVDRRKRASRVSSLILFRSSLFNRFIQEKMLSQIYVLPNIEHIFNAKSLKQGNCSLLTSFKKRHDAHSFLTTEKNLLVIHITPAENKMPETQCQLP